MTRKILSAFALILFGAMNCYAQSPLSKVGGKTYASAYANWRVTIQQAPTGTGAGTITVTPGVPSNPDGSQVVNAFQSAVGAIYTPIIVGLGSANQETVTPTAVSGCNQGTGGTASCSITATFANTHGPGDVVVSGDAGLQEAANALGPSGGIVVVDNAAGVTNAMLSAVVAQPVIAFEDTRSYAEQWWTVQAKATTVLGTPTTLTAVTALPSATPVGAFGTGTYHMCVAYVDIMGQEGTCSADFSQAGLATGSFIFSPPAASAGAVGYTIYIGLTGGGVTNLDYKVPLVTQPSAVGVAPAANGVCTLTTVETITPACAVTNTTYGSVGSTATVSVITLSTSPINPQTTVVSTTSIYVPNPGGRTTYGYVPGSHVGTPGLIANTLAFPITTAEVTVVPDVAGTINFSPGFMNYVGRTIEICGMVGSTATAATIVDIQFQWDAIGQNTAGKGVLIGDLTATPAVTLVTGKATFCQDFETTVAAATATGGSINHIGGGGAVGGVTLIGGGAFSDALANGAVGSLNLAEDARLNIIVLHTTATDGAGMDSARRDNEGAQLACCGRPQKTA